MTQLHANRIPRGGRIFPNLTRSPEEQARLEVEDKVFDARCWAIFERLRPALIENHYNWFIVIEPDSEDYFIERDDMVALKAALEKHPNALFFTFCLNETGVCGRI